MVWAILNPAQQAALAEITKFDSDRVAAILGGAMLDDSLRRTLEHRLRPSKDINKKLFKVSGALGNLGPKIDIAYQLYMFDDPIRNSMYGLNELRNAFAHDMSVSFTSQEKKITEAFDKISLQDENIDFGLMLPNPVRAAMIEPVVDRKSHYIVNLKLCLMWLIGDFVRHAPNSNVPAP